MEVSDQIINVLDKVCEKFGMVIDWSKDNALPYLQQLIHKIILYDICTSLTWLIVGIGMLFVGFYIFKKSKSFSSEKDDFVDIFSPKTKMVLLGTVIAVFGICVLIVPNFLNIVQDISFPEKTVVEFIKPYLE